MNQPETIHFEPREFSDPETGRRMTQLTHGDGFCYPLYYFIPTVTDDSATILFYRWADGQIQMYRLDIATGEARRLTNASSPVAPWRPWMQAPAQGVLDQLTAFNVVTREVIYFDGNAVRGVQIDTLDDRLIHEVPADRVPCGLTGVSPDGRHFVFPHADRAWWEAHQKAGPPRESGKGVCIDVIELASGQTRTVVRINSWITHTHFQDDERILFCHPPTENGIMFTDLKGGWYAHIRTQDGPSFGEQTSHYQSSKQGIMYEMREVLGLYDPLAFQTQEYTIVDYPVTHIGRDPEARMWFFDTKRRDPETGNHTGARCICFMPELKFNTGNKPILLMSGTRTFGEGQHSHLHPQLMPDRKNILFVIGDERSQNNHLCLLDISDLEDTRRETQK